MSKVNITTDVVFNQNASKDTTIIHLADIHFNINTKIKKLDKIKEKIRVNNPDYVVITGDTLDNSVITKNKAKIKELLMFLTDIASFTKIIISLGNHDVYIANDYKFFDNLNDLKNIYVVNNDSYQDERIFISGLTLPIDYYYNITGRESVDIFLQSLKNNKIMKKIPDNIPKVCLIHSPISLTDKSILNELYPYDLLLSGHTHNGMVPNILSKLFKTNSGIIAPNKKLFPKVARGKIEKFVNNKTITIIINGGITKLSERSAKILSKLNFIYDISLNKIIITSKRGKRYE